MLFWDDRGVKKAYIIDLEKGQKQGQKEKPQKQGQKEKGQKQGSEARYSQKTISPANSDLGSYNRYQSTFVHLGSLNLSSMSAVGPIWWVFLLHTHPEVLLQDFCSSKRLICYATISSNRAGLSLNNDMASFPKNIEVTKSVSGHHQI